jgi:hypothetical protein
VWTAGIAVTGSSYIPIVLPIVAFMGMAFWLGLVFYAAQHPGYRRRTPRRSNGGVAPVTSDTVAVPPGPLTDAGIPAGPRDHERIEEQATGPSLR